MAGGQDKAHLLYVEDDESLSFVTKDNLELKDYRVTHIKDGQLAKETFGVGKYDLCILDVMLPGIDGYTLASYIRSKDKNIPIIFLTAKSLKDDRLKGLRLGADDYLTKPFSIEELILKVEVFLRRSRVQQEVQKDQYEVGHFNFDYSNLLLQGYGNERTLTQKEADLLKMFAEKSNQVIKRSDILETLWGEDDYFMGRSLDVFISRLRKYLKPDEDIKIENIHGVGFKLRT